MAITLQPSFSLQQPEDSMEISSEYGNMDADIDIDLDAPDAADTNMMSFQQDDHQMQEDPRSDRPDDDLMIDDSNLEDTDRMMQDDAPPPQEQDEELLDFSEDEEDVPMNPAEPHQPELQHAPQPEAPVQQTTIQEEPVEQVQSEVASELLAEGVQPIDSLDTERDAAQVQPQVEAPQTVTDATVTSHEPSHPDQVSPDQTTQSEPRPQVQEEAQPVVDTASTKQNETPVQDPVVESTEIPSASNNISDQNVQATPEDLTEENHQEEGNDNDETSLTQGDDDQSVQRTLTRQETDLSNYTVPDDYSRERQPNSPTVTGLHPTIVEYQENEIYLFPSRDPAVPEQYLLQNENLVTTSLGDLLQACRTALADNIGEDEELVLGVEELDLFVSEDSTPAFSTSFSELLDMYLQLHKFDGNDNPPPFRVSLSTKTRFSNRLASITQAISEGKGFSQLPFLQYYDYDVPTELPDEDFDDDFNELTESDEQQQSMEEGASFRQIRQEVAEDEHAAEKTSAPTEELQTGTTDHDQEGEYEAEVSARAEVPADAVDQSEYNHDETQYFDAQGDESDLVGESHGDQEASDVAGVPSTTTDTHAIADEKTHIDGIDVGETADAEHVSEHNDGEDFEQQVGEQQEYEENGEQHVFGQGEFFDENYDYQDGEVNEEDNMHAAGEEVVSDGHNQAEQDAEASGVEQTALASPSVETAHENENESETGHEDTQDAVDNEDERDADQLTTAVAGIEHKSAAADVAASKDATKRHSPAVEDDDYDEINFDDEDGYDEEGAELAPVLTNTSSKASPGAKRSFSELEQADDEQDSKKARAS
ncbi:hypothetical protein E4T39_01167 [Aureobasidium subglaciale]|nr:hypothetical protein E4T39_01167 [Aureobasidium subglaciale]